MENTTMPDGLRRLLVIFGALLVISLLISGFSAVYVTLAASQRSTYVPNTVGFEGQLADAQGTPVADGSYSITFSLYTAASGGSPVWSETQPDVQVKDGLYSVQLGAVTTLDDEDFSGPRWLAVKVGSDAEMEPRIQVGAVPFALNAKQAQGLQGNPVADTAPSADNALMWNGSAWAPQGMTLPDLAAVGSNASPNDLLANYRSGAILTWKDANTVTVAPGELMVNGYVRRNTSAVDVKFAPDAGGNGPNRGLDTGTAQSNTMYYVYAVADDAESTFDLIISASSSAPTGRTNYRKLGSFETEAGNTNVKQGSIANMVESAFSAPAARVYNNSPLTLTHNATTTLTFNSERFDNNGLHSVSTNLSRLTAPKAGVYLIFASAGASQSQNTNFTVEYYIRLNGSTNIADQRHDGFYTTSVSTTYWLNEGDYVELRVWYWAVGGTYGTVRVDANYSPEFGMVRLSP